MSAQRISQRQGRSFSHHLMPMVALLSPISTWAAPPVPYGSWTRNAITGITAPCPTGYKCDINVKDRGILQRVLTDPQGQRYIQLIVDDGITRNNSQMTNESFVQGGGTSNNGIATKQHVSSSGATQLTSDVTLAKGWANNGKEAAVLISQSLFDNTNKKPVVYSSTFDIALHYAANTQLVTGSYMAMRQDVTNSTALNGATRATGRDVHSFVSRRASGDFV
ncbi:MAG: hypothetical protein OEW08_13340, partial [Gammaproteobacteria bacterium]|nr:hypothetical protein [Gammaproteobacteria bacterium]